MFTEGLELPGSGCIGVSLTLAGDLVVGQRHGQDRLDIGDLRDS